MADFDKMVNSELMGYVSVARGYLHHALSEKEHYDPTFWKTYKDMVRAESLMRARNLPLDHEGLGPRFTLAHFRTGVLVSGDGDDAENPADPADDGDFSGGGAVA